MSRIGKSPVALPKGVEVSVSKGNLVTVKGPKGQLSEQLDADITVSLEDGVLNVLRPTESKRHRSMHGLYRALVNNMVEGVTNGFVKEMEVIGVGYRVANTGQLLELTIGYSHPILFALPEEIKLTTAMEKGKSPLIRMECIDKQLLGQVAAKIRAFRKPEPYKGKGIRFAGEIVRRKAGKTAGKK
ncbi:MAG: 50S ribosomal protein L6 [Saprospiraceae bacterium]